MNEIQNYLQELLRIDCKIQQNLQNMLFVTNFDGLEIKSNEIKVDLKEFKEKLNEMKDFCDSFSATNLQNGSSIMRRLSRNSSSTAKDKNDQYANSEMFLDSEYKIQKEHLTTIETRFRTTYLQAKEKLNQIERESLFASDDSNEKSVEIKKRNLNKQSLLKETNQITNKLSDINRQLKWTENQTSDIIPVLDETSKLLKNTSEEFGFMKNAINDGKRLLIRLSRREFTDKLLIILCLCFFFLVVFYIVWKRLF